MKRSVVVSLAISFVFTAFDTFAENCVFSCPIGLNGQTITRSIYTLHNNPQTKFANWVAYHVTPETIDGPTRSRNWKADPELDDESTLEPNDYKGAWRGIGTDRGHQVPLASFSNSPDWRELNYLSNITPQDSDLNQGPWVKLENAVRSLVRTGQDVYVVSGPLYEWFFAALPDADEVHNIPSGYFKVIVTEINGLVEASAFIMQQNASRKDDYCTTQVTIDEVEARTGLDIMPILPEDTEAFVESTLGNLAFKLGCS